MLLKGKNKKKRNSIKKCLNIFCALILSLALTASVSAESFSPIYGVDVSEFQGDINWGQVAKTDKEFAIIRVGYNDKQDAKFETNYKNAKAVGIPVGCYMYSYAVTEQAAIEEAYIVMERIKGKQFEYPIYLDIEDPKLLKPEYNLTKKKRTDNALAFVRTMQENGYYVGVYANLNWFTNYLDVGRIKAECETWIAHYNPSYDYKNSGYGMWQYTYEGKVSGISGNVDLNICYKDYPSIIKSGGYNGYVKENIILNPTGVKGDLNADNKCDLKDVTLLSRYVAKWRGLSFVESELNANGDEEGKVDLTDVIYLARMVLDWNVQ